MKIYIHERRQSDISINIEQDLLLLSHSITDSLYCDLQIAPLLQKFLPMSEASKAKYGCLIFHPSLLPLYRGIDAIKWQYHYKEKTGGATWFWISDGFDEGDICEQEAIPIDLEIRPRDYYNNHIIPSARRMIRRAVTDIDMGIIRRIPQINDYATFQPRFHKNKHSMGGHYMESQETT